MNLSPQEIDALLSNTPDTEENQQLVAMLLQLKSNSAVVKYPFTFLAPFYTAGAANSIAAGVTAPAYQVIIGSDAPFLILSQTYWANTANAAVTKSTSVEPNIVVLLEESGTGRKLMDQAVPVAALFGTAQLPYILPEPKLMPANSVLSVTPTNRDAAAGYNLYLAFHGYRLFKPVGA